MDTIMACLSPCFKTQEPPAETSSFDTKHSNKVRARLGKPLKPINTPIEMVASPAAAFDRFSPMSPRPKAAPSVPPATTPLTATELGELFDKVDETLSGPNIHYAICGLAAMIAHGLTGRGANTVSILVPEDSKDVIRPWVLAGGNMVTKKDSTPHGFEVLMSNGTTRGIKIRWIEGAAFEKLGIIRSHMGSRSARMLTLASCLEQVASAFLKECRGGKPPTPSKHVDTIVQDIRGALESATVHKTSLDPAYLELFLSHQFWSPYHAYMGDERISEIMLLCTRARLPVAEALAEARRHSEVRQHDALLSQYGVQPMLGVVEQQPGAFHNMRTLGRDTVPSTYTLKSKESRGSSDLLPSPTGRSLTAKPRPMPSPLGRGPLSARESGPSHSRSSSSVRVPQDKSKMRESLDLVDARSGRPDGWM
ncbi:hypothetical protein PFICI_13555 [Pestalotiopsis fici W106-1]|uniref:Uncharacterized protein n=1 Tax=Pestalotiopsis fici (strain W106-1 / CGMCC3.15140) TaxID=1229662 RepID=W3WQG3_PESFW|nr:uncharacterized protein PFICI_13555 [Pestalotiopsis fici W106-1]ETS75071.1 hypothetical protein PFICI_13555 [Pestalotiopsis fici W106-1]